SHPGQFGIANLPELVADDDPELVFARPEGHARLPGFRVRVLHGVELARLPGAAGADQDAERVGHRSRVLDPDGEVQLTPGDLLVRVFERGIRRQRGVEYRDRVLAGLALVVRRPCPDRARGAV